LATRKEWGRRVAWQDRLTPSLGTGGVPKEVVVIAASLMNCHEGEGRAGCVAGRVSMSFYISLGDRNFDDDIGKN
jgi:hypothetical protein